VSLVTSELARLGWLKKDGNGGRSKTAQYRLTVPETLPNSGTVSEAETLPESGSVCDPETLPKSGSKTLPESGRGKEENFEEKKTPPCSPSSRGSRFNADTLPDDWRAWTQTHHPQLDADAVFEVFADYWRAVPGAKGRKTDWLATWRNWCRREAKNADSRTPRTQSRTDRNEQLQREAEQRALDAWHSGSLG